MPKRKRHSGPICSHWARVDALRMPTYLHNKADETKIEQQKKEILAETLSGICATVYLCTCMCVCVCRRNKCMKERESACRERSPVGEVSLYGCPPV